MPAFLLESSRRAQALTLCDLPKPADRVSWKPVIAGWGREVHGRESEMESCGTMEPKALTQLSLDRAKEAGDQRGEGTYPRTPSS